MKLTPVILGVLGAQVALVYNLPIEKADEIVRSVLAYVEAPMADEVSHSREETLERQRRELLRPLAKPPEIFL